MKNLYICNVVFSGSPPEVDPHCARVVRGSSHLVFQAKEVQVTPVDFNAEFIAKIIPKVEWSALFQAAESVSFHHRGAGTLMSSRSDS